MPFFAKKSDAEKKNKEGGDIRRKYDFKDTLGT